MYILIQANEKYKGDLLLSKTFTGDTIPKELLEEKNLLIKTINPVVFIEK
ncbi:hypothetical protein KQI89_13015 [Clostridium sp. MSJ-4]|uniref:Uncharacterized protein n=1 Tax=Clostridium simiarum TaxID=2841506 RepID=A0ABS6F2Z1_9CLOT|nr:hypothetical protein [Clostridium simiarum]